MILYRTGNMLDAPGIPVIPVNCVGVMGKGLAKQAAEKWPWIVPLYKYSCKNSLTPGNFWQASNGDITVFLLATKDHWRDPSKLVWVQQGLLRLSMLGGKYANFNLPKLGCGLGGLEWKDVKPLMVKYLTDAPGTFNIYE